jgi:signal transduction histidine kinase
MKVTPSVRTERDVIAEPSKTPSIRWHRRMEARVALGICLLIASSLGAALIATTTVVTTRSLERASQDLEAARSAFYHLVSSRTKSAAAQTRLITALPVFRAFMSDVRLREDAATIRQMADDYRRELNGQFAVVTDRGGRWLASPGWPEGTPLSLVQTGIDSAGAGRSHHDILAIRDRLFLVVFEPARFAEETLGTMSVGYVLDDAVAEELARITRCEVSLVTSDRLAGTSLPASDRPQLAVLLSGGQLRSRQGVAAAMHRIGASTYVAGAFPLRPDPAPDRAGHLVLLQDWRPTEQSLHELRGQLLQAGGLIFAIALAGGYLFSRRISRPLGDIAAAARRIASGDWTIEAPVRGSEEAKTLATSFNEMTTSLRHSHEEVRKRDEQLLQAQKMEAIGRLAGGVAHDFNNMLTAIIGYGELLMFSLEETDARRGQAKEILEAAGRAAGLTRQLLIFSRRHAFEPQPIALDAIVAGVYKMLRRLIGEHIDLVSQHEGGPWRVHADPGQMEQVLMNLAVNARDAMPTGGRLEVRLTNVQVKDTRPAIPSDLQPGRYVQLAVSDTGCGMDADVVSHIFEPFFTTKPEGQGTGLGLSTVYGIVQQSAGAIEVESQPGQGTTFRVYLPEVSETGAAAEGIQEATASPAA